jgi:hypothetical protein
MERGVKMKDKENNDNNLRVMEDQVPRGEGKALKPEYLLARKNPLSNETNRRVEHNFYKEGLQKELTEDECK